MSDQLLEKLMRENAELQSALQKRQGGFSLSNFLFYVFVGGLCLMLILTMLPGIVATYAPWLAPPAEPSPLPVAPGEVRPRRDAPAQVQPAQVQAPPAVAPTVATQPTVAAPTAVVSTAPPVVEDAAPAGQPVVLLPGGDVVWPTSPIMGISQTFDEVREQATAAAQQETEGLDLGPLPGFGP